VPQGCPFSPLAFLIIAEGLTRLIEDCADIEGIEINGAVMKISKIADDTQIIVRTYESIQKVWPMLEKYKKATNMRGNK
jgi:frataxin-like iron-binding protein CyaY